MGNLPFGFNNPKDSPGFLLWQTTVIWQRLIKEMLGAHDISHAQFVIMALVLWLKEHGHSTTQTVIATWSKLDKMTISKSLKKLVTQGMIKRSEHKDDSRAKDVSLTQKGKSLTCKLIPMVEGIDAEFFSRISAEETQTLIRTLSKLTSDGYDLEAYLDQGNPPSISYL